MPKGLARTEPVGIWSAGATATEQVLAARRWASRLLHGPTVPPPFHPEGTTAAAGRMP